jgi:hypothetical protein
MPVNTDFGLHALEELERFLRLLGFVPLIILPEDLIRSRIHDDRFDRRRTHVQADEKFRHVVVRFLSGLRLRYCGFGFKPRNLNQRRTFVIVVVHFPLSGEHKFSINSEPLPP